MYFLILLDVALPKSKEILISIAFKNNFKIHEIVIILDSVTNPNNFLVVVLFFSSN